MLLGLGTLLWLLVIDVFVFTQAAGPGVAAICALACLPTTAFGLLVVRRMDRNEKEPWRLVLVAAAWGAIVATSLVIWGETVWDQVAQRTLVPGPGLDASTAFSAGLLEELAKGLAVVLLFLVMRNDFDDVVDGIVYGAAVGLGFNFLESIAYMTNLYAIFSPDGIGCVRRGPPVVRETGTRPFLRTCDVHRVHRSWARDRAAAAEQAPESLCHRERVPDRDRRPFLVGCVGAVLSRSTTRCSGWSRCTCGR